MTAMAVADTATQTQPRASKRGGILLDALTLLLACTVFLALCLYQLDLPGLYPDEAFDVVPAMQIVLGHAVDVQRGAGVHLFGTDLPLMSSSDYQGVTSTYLALPFFALGGVNVFSLRLMTVLVGVLGVILSFFLARAWFGVGAARLTVLMMAVSPAWVFWSRVGVYVVSEVVPITAGALLALTVWVRRRPLGKRNGALYAAAFLVGLGLATKLLFVWVIVALLACDFVLYARPLWENRRVWLRDWARWTRISLVALVAFCIGAFPFLLYNVLTRGTYHLLRATLSSQTTTHGVDNSAYLRNLWTKADDFKTLLDGGYFWFQGVDGHAYANPLTPAVFVVAAVGLLALTIGKRTTDDTINPHSALRTPHSALRWVLLIVGVLAGAIWWFGGAGRPKGSSGLDLVDIAGVLFWVSGAALMLLLGFDRAPSPHQRTTVAMLTLIGVAVAQSAVTVSGLSSTHLILLLPLPQIAIAALGMRIAQSLKSKVQSPMPAIRWALAALFVLPILVGDLIVDYSYHRDLTLTGGATTFSDSIYKLAAYLDPQPPTPNPQPPTPNPKVVAMDWGFKRPIQFLTQDRVNPIEAYGYTTDPTPEFRAGVRVLLNDPNTLYLFRPPESTAYHRFAAFEDEAKAQGKTVTLVETFYVRDGKPNYLVYRVTSDK